MFKVVLNDGQNEMPEDDIYYIIAKEGVYLKKKLGVMESLAPVSKISILKSVNSMAKMHITPIPGKWIAKVMEFFKAVYTEHRSEAIVLLFYNAETGKHKIVPPMQKVAGASCDYDKGITIENYAMIGTIHSHGSMSAFHSGTDDKDEEHFDGLHITLGDLNEENPSISASIVANGYRVMIEPTEYINDLVLMSEINQVKGKPVRTVYKIVDGQLIEDKQETSKYTYAYGYKKFDRRYGVLVSARDRIFNKKWLKMVEKGTYTYKSYRAGQQQTFYGFNGYAGYRNPASWGENYDPNAWAGVRRILPASTPGTRVSPLNVGTQVAPLKFPPHNQEGEFVPCATCVHKLCKLTSEIEDEDYDEDGESLYQCTQCGELVNEEIGVELQCQGCKTDDHLILVDEKNLLNSYVPSDEFDHLFEKEREASSYIKCNTCGNGFHMFDKDALCPFCQHPVNPQLYSSEESLESQAIVDSGEFLTSEQEEINDEALRMAREADETIERIPEPGSDVIPISRKRDTGLAAMFRRVFSKEMSE